MFVQLRYTWFHHFKSRGCHNVTLVFHVGMEVLFVRGNTPRVVAFLLDKLMLACLCLLCEVVFAVEDTLLWVIDPAFPKLTLPYRARWMDSVVAVMVPAIA